MYRITHFHRDILRRDTAVTHTAGEALRIVADLEDGQHIVESIVGPEGSMIRIVDLKLRADREEEAHRRTEAPLRVVPDPRDS